MFPQLGAPVGFIAANGLFLLLGLGLDDADFAAWGWRIPFLLSAILVGLGLWVRLKITETPDFAEALEKDAPVAVPIGDLVRHHLVPRDQLCAWAWHSGARLSEGAVPADPARRDPVHGGRHHFRGLCQRCVKRTARADLGLRCDRAHRVCVRTVAGIGKLADHLRGPCRGAVRHGAGLWAAR
jgi:hypothetical protein